MSERYKSTNSFTFASSRSVARLMTAVEPAQCEPLSMPLDSCPRRSCCWFVTALAVCCLLPLTTPPQVHPTMRLDRRGMEAAVYTCSLCYIPVRVYTQIHSHLALFICFSFWRVESIEYVPCSPIRPASSSVFAIQTHLCSRFRFRVYCQYSFVFVFIF